MRKFFMAALALFCVRGTVLAWQPVPSAEGGLPALVERLKAEAAAVPSPAAAGGAEWTVMVYVNAKNDLEYFGLADLNEMERAGSSEKVNVVAELGRLAVYDDGDGGWSGVRRYLVQKDEAPKAITSPVLETLAADMGDWRHLAEFGKWAKKKFPAKRYMLVVWNHGSGWEKSLDAAGVRGISYDYDSGNHINTPQLAEALKEMGKVDVLAFDACLMQMAEVVYEVEDLADYVVGSEETEPGPGYPYDTFLAGLLADPAMAPEKLSRLLVDAYHAYYDPRPGSAAMQSAVRTSAMPKFLELVNGWVEAVMAGGEKDAVNAAVRAAQRFDTVDNKDLYDFLRLAAAESGRPEIKAKSAELMAFLGGELVLAHKAAGTNYTDSHGLAVFLPVYHYDENYDELRWARDSRWNEFIDWYPR